MPLPYDVFSVLQALQGCRDPAASGNEVLAGLIVDGHDGRTAKQSTHFHAVTNHLVRSGNNADGSGLGVDHTDGGFVGDDGGNGGCGSVAGNDDHGRTQ